MADPVQEFDQYRGELLAALGSQEPIAVLRQTLADVEEVVSRTGAARLREAAEPGEWSPWQVLHHLDDSDDVWGVRIRMILVQDHPLLVGYDQEAWVARFGGLDPEPRDTLERWRALRLSNLRLLDSLSPAEWERAGRHQERGEQSVREIVMLLAGHDLVHRDQLLRQLQGGTKSPGDRPSTGLVTRRHDNSLHIEPHQR